MRHRTTIAGVVVAVALAASAAFLLSGQLTSQAVQNPTISLDMVTSGNGYSDPGAAGDNSMTVGAIDNCLTTEAPGDNSTHVHPVHVVIHDVEDLVAWQIRLNYDGGGMRPHTANYAPFTDTQRGQAVSFINIPVESTTGIHREVLGNTDIPAAAPGSQTAFIGSFAEGSDTFPLSPDTPAKSPPDDTSYSAPSGGVLATLNLQVLSGNAGHSSLFMNLDDDNPNGTGSKAIIFTGEGSLDLNLPPGALGDGYHGEGAPCVPLDCVNNECPPGTPAPTPTPPAPTATPLFTPAPRDPKISLDMDTSGNSYSDPGAGGDNSMTVGAIDSCLMTAAPGNNNTHLHTTHLVINDVADMIAWQVRLNYDGGKMRPHTVSFTPFFDSGTGQFVSFANLPLDPSTGVHRDVQGGISIPAAAPGPQTALFGAGYVGSANAAVSPDTPAKSPPDDSSYDAPTGGVLAALTLQVLAGNAGNPSLFMNLDDNSPNFPGSKLIMFTDSGSREVELTSGALGDGYHGEGVDCVPMDCTTQECPQGEDTPTPTATATASPTPGPSTPSATPTPTSVSGPQTSVVFDSEPGDFIGGGQQLIFKDLCSACYHASSPSPSTFQFFFNSQGHSFNIDFEALQGSPLVAGTYENATRYPFNSPDQPGLSISGDGRGCNTLTGRFVVHEAEYAPSGAPVRFAASFEQHCEGGPRALFGELRFNSAVPLRPLGYTPASLFFGTIPVGTSQMAGLEVINTGSSPLSISDVSVSGPNAGDFFIVSDACRNTVVPVGESCFITVRFTPGGGGPRNATLTINDDSWRGRRDVSMQGSGQSTPTPTRTPSPTATRTASPAPTPSPTRTASPAPTPSPTPGPTGPCPPTPGGATLSDVFLGSFEPKSEHKFKLNENPDLKQEKVPVEAGVKASNAGREAYDVCLTLGQIPSGCTGRWRVVRSEMPGKFDSLDGAGGGYQDGVPDNLKFMRNGVPVHPIVIFDGSPDKPIYIGPTGGPGETISVKWRILDVAPGEKVKAEPYMRYACSSVTERTYFFDAQVTPVGKTDHEPSDNVGVDTTRLVIESP